MVNWQPLLDGSGDISGIAVGGACVGDTVSALPFRDITHIAPKGPMEHVAWDDPRGMVTRESPLEEIRKYGGEVSAGPVTYEVANGRIHKILVRGTFLSTLPFATEADIERLLGPSSGVERKPDQVVYHYQERGFSVGWHAQEGRIEHVTLGADGRAARP